MHTSTPLLKHSIFVSLSVRLYVAIFYLSFMCNADGTGCLIRLDSLTSQRNPDANEASRQQPKKGGLHRSIYYNSRGIPPQ